ncbi:hypothetical protein Desgi_2563 [Desulfoscipio gibsoniae DSM 7213]|uniref:Uncharacterized protein n=1 Tax=Desulfoscipio gibsoniae DSM 7213 TaxID=767817 RepID=R4KH77_9FIRM|nr:hypothetical protein Desgi_2563 [Desulfoscipio gibsoniae DSM 7213]
MHIPTLSVSPVIALHPAGIKSTRLFQQRIQAPAGDSPALIQCQTSLVLRE